MSEFVTFSRNVFLPVTNVCRNRCEYCGFRREPGDPDAQLMCVEDIISVLVKGKEAGCTEALFTFGEYADEVPEYKKWLNKLGYSTTIEYLVELCNIAIGIGLLPHTNAGSLTRSDLEVLKPLNASMGLMLETTARLTAHRDCPGKEPELRLKTIRAAGELRIPFTTGILVGIGESVEDRIDSLQSIAAVHEEYGHIQEVIIQNFTPKPNTSMADHVPPTREEMMQAVRLARTILSPDVAVQVAPNLIDPYTLIKCGVSDLGGISPTTIDWINPESEWPGVSELQKMVQEISLRERLPIYPQYVQRGWYNKNLKELIKSLSDKKGYRKTLSV